MSSLTVPEICIHINKFVLSSQDSKVVDEKYSLSGKTLSHQQMRVPEIGKPELPQMLNFANILCKQFAIKS